MDDEYFAAKAAERARRAEEREKRRAEESKLLASFDERRARRQENRDAREELIAKAESEAKLKASVRGASGEVDAEAAARRRQEMEAEEAKRQEEKRRREAEREAQRAAAAAAAEEEERTRRQKEEERKRARDEAERQLEAQRKKDEADREAARQARLQAQREAEAAEALRREAEKQREAERRAAEEEAKKAELAARKAKQEEEARKEDEARVEAARKKDEAKKQEEKAVAEAQAKVEAKKAEDARIAAEEAKKAEAARIAAEQAKKAEDALTAAEEAKKAEDARIAAEQAKKAEDAAEEAKKAEDARIAAEQAQKADDARIAAEEAKKAEDDRIAAEEAKKAEDTRIAAEEARIAEEERLLAEEEALLLKEQERSEKEAQLKKQELENELKRLAEEEEILRADEARLAAEEASAAANGKEKVDDEELDDEEAALLAEEETLRQEEEALKREEEAQREENARLLAEEEDELAREEAELEAMQKKTEAMQKKAESEEGQAAAAKDEAEENARIEAELLREDEERAKAAAAAATVAEEEAKKAEDERIAAEEAKAEDDRIAAEEAKKAEDAKKTEDARIAAEEEAKKKETEKPAAVASAVPPAASKKAAFMAALNNKIGLGGPPPKPKPEVKVEETPAVTSPSSETMSPSSPDVTESSPEGTQRLTHLTQNRAKGPQRKHRATMTGIRSRLESDGSQTFFVGEVKATPHVDGQSETAAAGAAPSSEAGSASDASAEPPAPTEASVKRLPPGAIGMPGMMGGLMAAMKKSEQRRGAGATNAAAPSPSAPESKLPNVRLIQVRGKGKDLFVRLVEPTLAGLSHDSAFILEDVKASTLYVWSGYNANKMQTTKCLDLMNRINRVEHAGRAQSKTFRAGEEPAEFWTLLGVAQASATTAKSVAQNSALPIVVDTLYRVDPTETGFALMELASETKNLERGLLWSDACYVLDSGYEVRVWIGKASPKEMREATSAQANEMLTKPMKNGDARPAWSQFVYKETDRGETALFTDKFGSWPAEYKPKVAAAPPSRAGAPSAAPIAASPSSPAGPAAAANAKAASPAKPSNSRMVPYDGATMAAIERPASADQVLPDEGIDGSFTVWLQEGFEKKPLPKSRIGIYDDSHCYLELYTWGMPGSERHMVYFWQGQATSPNDQGSVAGLAREVNERICKGSGQLVRVPQFQENEHFLLCHSMQSQPYVSLGNSLNGAFDGLSVRFIQVRGKTANDTRAHQIQLDATMLNTNDCFLVILDSGKTAPMDQPDSAYLSEAKELYIWQGKESDKFCREYAAQLAKRLVGESLQATVLEQGSESPKFWSVLGQKDGFSDFSNTAQSDFKCKIYMCTANSQEGFKIGRIWDYSNADVCSDRVLIIEDSTHNVFVWMGARTAEPERRLSLESSLSYAQTVSSPTPVSYMYEGHETVQFKSLFHGWASKPQLDTKSVSGSGLVTDLLPLYSATYSLAQLKDRASLPPTVDQAHLEYHLNRDDFPEALKMTQNAFFALPEWKRLEAKKSSPIY